MIYVYIHRKREHCILQDVNMFLICGYSAAYAVSDLHSFKNIKQTEVLIFFNMC